jgi:hypothetical protein
MGVDISMLLLLYDDPVTQSQKKFQIIPPFLSFCQPMRMRDDLKQTITITPCCILLVCAFEPLIKQFSSVKLNIYLWENYNSCEQECSRVL